MEKPMKSLTAILALVVFATLPAMAEETPEQIMPQLQSAYDQNTKAMDETNIDAFMALFADDYVGKIPPAGSFDREQIREIATGEMKHGRRARSTYVIEKVELVNVDTDGGKRREIVATVLQSIVNEAIDREGKKVRKSLEVRFRDTVVKNGANWQISVREPQ